MIRACRNKSVRGVALLKGGEPLTIDPQCNLLRNIDGKHKSNSGALTCITAKFSV